MAAGSLLRDDEGGAGTHAGNGVALVNWSHLWGHQAVRDNAVLSGPSTTSTARPANRRVDDCAGAATSLEGCAHIRTVSPGEYALGLFDNDPAVGC